MRALVLLSGGLDSAVALYWTVAQGWDVRTIEFDYFQRPEHERKACRRLMERAGLGRGIVMPVPFLRETVDIPADELLNPVLAGAPQGYIPSRNLIFYSLSAYQAEILGARYIVGGHNLGDGESFPDAGKDFWRRLNLLLENGMWSHRRIHTEILLPLLEMKKIEVVRLGRSLGVPFDLTWSCYYDAEEPCGRCESCLERRLAMDSISREENLR